MPQPPLLNSTPAGFVPGQMQPSHRSSPVSPGASTKFIEEGQQGFLHEPSPVGADRNGPSAQPIIGHIYRAADGDNNKTGEIVQNKDLDDARVSRFLAHRSKSPTTVAEKTCSDNSGWTSAGSDGQNDATNNSSLNQRESEGEARAVSDRQGQALPSSLGGDLHDYKRELIQSLAFPGMNHRQDCISEAHENTFRLSLDTDNTINRQPRPYGGFAQWLASGKGMFCVSGEPGSGKSTFMKHISQDPHAFHLLASWSRPKPCVVLSYFFWNRGRTHQKSLEGLLRTLIFQILSHNPELVAIAFPSEFNTKTSRITNDEWGIGELVTAFKNITEDANTPFWICVFVDGADEYEEDPLDLVFLLRRISSSPCTKLCVSSRPGTIFTDIFEHGTQTIRLEKFTQYDISNYTRAILHRYASPANLDSITRGVVSAIVDEVTIASQGVFFWATIFVISTIRAIERGGSLSDVWLGPDSVTGRLESLYKATLKSNQQIYLKRLGKMVKVALQANEHLPPSLYCSVDDHGSENQTKFDQPTHGPTESSSHHMTMMHRRMTSPHTDTPEVHAGPPDKSPVPSEADLIFQEILAIQQVQEFFELKASNFEAKKGIDILACAVSNSSFDSIKPAREVLVEFLLEDIEIFPLLKKAATDPDIGVDRLARNFHRLLNSYSRELSRVAQSRLQREAAKFVRHNSEYVSDVMRIRFDASKGPYILGLCVDLTEDEQKAAAKERLIKLITNGRTPVPLGLDQASPSPANVVSSLDDEEKFDTNYDQEEITKALTQVMSFLECGPPLGTLREGLRTFVQFHKDRNNHVHFRSLPILIDRTFDLLMPLQEPPVPDGKKRVRWICHCGTRLFDDFIELEPGAVENLEVKLQQRASTGGFEAVKEVGKLLAAAIKTWITLPFTRKGPQNPPPVSTPLPLHSTNVHAAPAILPSWGNLRLLLCIDKGDFQTKLHQKIIDRYSSDKQIFRFFNGEYHDYRKFKTWFMLRGISQLSLTRFAVDLGCFAEVHKHPDTCDSSCVCLPPTNKIDVEYRCNPAPKTNPGYVPAIGPARLTHYFRSPECVGDKQTTIYAQLPKRICGELLASDTKEELGWGIHFQEGWHWRTIYVIVVFFLFSFSLIFGVAWSVSKADIQGAFAISSFWLTLGSILLGYLAVRSQ